jgi:hypothetical protein
MVYTDVYGKTLLSEARRIHPLGAYLVLLEQCTDALNTIPETMQGFFSVGVQMISTQRVLTKVVLKVHFQG